VAIDRRVQRTRTALYEALVQLIREKDYDAISVEDLLRAANVGRSTFYAHFTSKDDLLARSLDRLKALLADVAAAQQAASAGPHTIARELTLALFRHVAEYRDVQLALAGGRGAAVVNRALTKALTGVVHDLPLEAPRGLPRELAVAFTISTFTAVLSWWFERRPQMPPDDAATLFLDLVYRGLENAPPGRNFRMSNHVP
jgi:AcrR family transcriptional regulator